MPSYQFTYNQEIGHQGQSLIPHFPGGISGVTIGPGYDMKYRDPAEIYEDLTRIGVPPEMAYSLAGAAGLSGSDAQQWLSQAGGIYLTEAQQRALFVEVLVPQYEERLQQQLVRFAGNYSISPEDARWDNLSLKQKEALFDFVYNTGSIERFPEMTRAVLEEDWDAVSLHYERFSDGQPLAYRNEMFYREFLDPSYERQDAENTYDPILAPSRQEADSQFASIYAAPDSENDDAADTGESGSPDDDWYENI